MKPWLRRSLILPPVLIAAAVLVVAPKLKKPPQPRDAGERAVKVRTIEVQRLPLLLRVTGYSSTRPARTWEAVAEVAGRVTWVSDSLEEGALVAAGTELLRIDDTPYRLALAQAEARLKSLEVKDRTTRASLALEQRSQDLLRKDIERKRTLERQGTLSAASFEEAERALLKGEVTIQNLKNSLALNDAERELAASQVESARLDLARTRFQAPFDVRIVERRVDLAGYAAKGQQLFSGDGIETVEVEARFPIGRLRPLIRAGREEGGEAEPLARQPGAQGLNALVRLRTATHQVTWKARVDRVAGTVDPETQTIGVVVAVDDPYRKARPGQRPPLVRNTFVEVELSRRLPQPALLVPASALHDDRLYLVDADDRLVVRPVRVALRQGGVAVIAAGVAAGDTVVLSNPAPAVPGMLLDPVADERALKRLRREAAGKSEGERR